MKKWYDEAIIYQIYPKSFQDSNNDGIGDLQGIKQRIPYLKRLGINTVWLNPVFVSPQVDNGYDVANYFAIDEKMGTMADMEDLISALHQNGIRIIMDFVLNHTSDQHPWFKDAIANPKSIYRDYYLFAGENGHRPNNWGSFFGGSVWEPDPKTGQFYFHLFDKHMPDLNWKNPGVRKAMLDIAEFWLKKGIDGLRLDAFIHIAKADFRQNYPAPEGQIPVAEPFFANLPEVVHYLRPFCQQIKQDYPDCLLLGEAASANVNLAANYTDPENNLLDAAITFRCFTEDDSQLDSAIPANYQVKPFDFEAFKLTQMIWEQTLAGISKPVLYWSNHDMSRLRTRIAKNDLQAKSLAMLLYLKRGIPIIYYGEELGLKNLAFQQLDDFKDQTVFDFAKKAEKQGYSEAEILTMVSQTHKMPARGVMPWKKAENYGFSKHHPWLTGKKQDEHFAEAEIADSESFFNFYRQLIALKKTPLFMEGSYYLHPTSSKSFIYQRDLGDESALVVVNLTNKPLKVKTKYQKVILSNGQYSLNDNELQLAPFAGLVLERN